MASGAAPALLACASFRLTMAGRHPAETAAMRSRKAKRRANHFARKAGRKGLIMPAITNTESILARVNDIIASCNFQIGLRNLAADLEAKLRAELAASNNRGSALKAVTSMLKAVGEARLSLRYAWIDAENRQCVCDGFQAYRLRNHLPLEPRPENAGEPLRLDKLFPDSTDGWYTLPMPSVGELRAQIAAERAKAGGKRRDFVPCWDFGEHAPVVDARILLNAAILFPAVKELRWLRMFSPLVFSCDDGDGMVLPMRIANGTMIERTPPEPQTDAQRKALEEANARLNAQNKAVRDDAAAKQAETKKNMDAEHALVNAWDEARHECLEALKAIDAAESFETQQSAKERWFVACERKAKVSLDLHAIRCKLRDDESMSLNELTRIVSELNVRKYNAA